MRKSISAKALALALLISVASLGAHAAGLGRLTVNSGLGQPLNAEVEILALQPGEEDSLTARLAPSQAFAQAGIQFNPALLNLRFAVERKDGKPVLRLSTAQPIDEPFLELLIELQSGTGRLVREYTFLLDPPSFRAPAAAAPAPASAPRLQPVPEPAKPAATAPASAAPVSASPAAASQPGSTYEVKKGDTLGAIARRNLAPGVSLGQMLTALYRSNAEAFIGQNMNRLRSGRILNLPSAEEAGRIEAAEAARFVASHNEGFSAYRRTLAAAAAAAPGDSAAGQREASGRITAKPEEPKAEAPQDKVRLSKSDSAKAGTPASKSAGEDDATARSRALQEAQSRVSELEKNVSDLQNLVQMRNQQLAQLESKAGSKVAPEPAAKAADAAPSKAPEAKADAPKAQPDSAKAAPAEKGGDAAKAADAPTQAPAPEASKDGAAADAPKGGESAQPAPKAAPKPRPAPPPPPPEPSIVDEFLGNPIYLVLLALVILLLGAYGWIAWKKKRAAHSKFQDSVLSTSVGLASAAGAASIFSTAAVPAAEAASVSEAPVSDASATTIEAEEVDPIAEADVYMAYGRDAQAEEILKEALQKDSNRTSVHVKLLEIYSNRRDTKSFAQIAGQLKSVTGGVGAEWDRAVSLGAALDPQNALYSGASAVAAPLESAATPAAPSLDLDLDLTSPGTPTLPAGLPEAAAAPALDFDLGGDTGSTPAAPAGDLMVEFTPGGTQATEPAREGKGDMALDFDLGEAATPAAAPAAAPVADAGSGLDFDLDLDLGGNKAAALASAAEPSLDLSSISLDLGGVGDTATTDPKLQEVATKLDLAKAYRDMGDNDGARELLNEVLRDGDDAQKSQAQSLLSSLG